MKNSAVIVASFNIAVSSLGLMLAYSEPMGAVSAIFMSIGSCNLGWLFGLILCRDAGL